ncbi:class I SAM-dependent methyltransferase [Methanimicrococcus blatticola]|uniref:Ubiquinone/menaquinone biosynthesis C-methylase UbiE n=1 Tax=Methanimicrococcus blatticola TaxID=91560 RepID=A0A484F5W8_9EURY|nr:class I SAM-dependent methyltransferase [Methanimicrococcus blatticola]MBZ3935774.1 methyltransferase domain-containing protein [Methanimicrococcus blatticola]MCC2508106.1 class I SAM-dependent methyltransferase [Methanimicrococcus blatticola]TDQ68815.1 ubiquinone/menaquinone biosynthesis C-methylase UbiE [Methanimicrococcus blatticola]
MTVSKKDVNAWDIEYEHLKWGGLSELSWIQNRLKENGFLLDAGSGEGRYLREFCFKFPCIGIDISKNALIRSIESIRMAAEKKASPGFSFPEHIVSNTVELPFSNEIFDGVLCLGVMQHLVLEDREKTAAEFYRTLKKGGLLFFEVFGEEDMRCSGEPAILENEKMEPRTFERQNGILYHYFDENEIKTLFEKNGFQTLELKSIKKEKKYNGESYTRHHYRAVFEK